MKIFSQLSLLLFCCVFGISLFGQAPKFDVVSSWVDNDSAYLQLGNDDTVNFTVKVVSRGPNNYSGPLRLQSYYQQKGYTDTVFSADTILTDVGAGDTITFSHQDVILPTSTRYKGGGNIVIVWPYSPAISIGDSGSTGVWVDGIIGIHEKLQLANRVSIYPNPAITQLAFDYTEAQHLFEGVRITNLNGKVIYESGELVRAVDLTEMPRGIYLVTLTYSDGIQGTYKLILKD